jgi:hypothetical protein
MTPDTSPRLWNATEADLHDEDILARASAPHDVARWHCHPNPILRNSGDTISRHQIAVRMLAVALSAWIDHPIYDGRLIEYCEKHDEPEKLFGDWPGPICKRPEVAAIKAALEAEYWAAQPNPLPIITALEYQMFDLCDKLEAVIWAKGLGVAMPHDLAACQAKARAIGPAAVAWLEGALDAGQGTG